MICEIYEIFIMPEIGTCPKIGGPNHTVKLLTRVKLILQLLIFDTHFLKRTKKPGKIRILQFGFLDLKKLGKTTICRLFY